MPACVEIDIADERWGAAWPGYELKLNEIYSHVLAVSGLPVGTRDMEISVVLTHDAQIQHLNKQHRGKDAPTNVLSFPSYESGQLDGVSPSGPPLLLGDLALAYETTAREAEVKAVPLAHHATHLVIHGILHLLGFDHQNDIEADDMEAKEVEFCRDFGIANPYRASL